MVGTPKSTGCENCRKRKKKATPPPFHLIGCHSFCSNCAQCGGEVPQCWACVKAGWSCPGYAKRWKFVDESKRTAIDERRKKYSFDETSVVEINSFESANQGFQDYEDYGFGSGSFRVGVFRTLSTE